MKRILKYVIGGALVLFAGGFVLFLVGGSVYFIIGLFIKSDWVSLLYFLGLMSLLVVMGYHWYKVL